ncbi:MAG TPA: hypothetical protein PLQ88_12125 [Blastocatellia bacterium]|nr:hypothetical protein [Blastocatellia bacterium]HMY72573.1 hypothetical protein [Blastocatellia bacterium]HNG32755.1 hypothetical protein [Blastocatellia bacterium]
MVEIQPYWLRASDGMKPVMESPITKSSTLPRNAKIIAVTTKDRQLAMKSLR